MAFLKWMDGLGRVGKIIFCLPILDIVWGIYRLVDSIVHFNALKLVIAILWVLFGGFVLWILDIIWILAFNRICWFK